MRPAAELLAIEARMVPPILVAADTADFDLPTVCAGWSVRDVLAHCAAALTRVANRDLHRFTPTDNQIDVDERRPWPIDRVIDELVTGYQSAATAIDATGGLLDAIGLGEWMHGGDVREPLGQIDAHVSPGVQLTIPLLLDRSVAMDLPSVEAIIEGQVHDFGREGPVEGRISTDTETFIRLVGGRRPDPRRSTLEGITAEDLVLFG